MNCSFPNNIKQYANKEHAVSRCKQQRFMANRKPNFLIYTVFWMNFGWIVMRGQLARIVGWLIYRDFIFMSLFRSWNRLTKISLMKCKASIIKIKKHSKEYSSAHLAGWNIHNRACTEWFVYYRIAYFYALFMKYSSPFGMECYNLYKQKRNKILYLPRESVNLTGLFLISQKAFLLNLHNVFQNGFFKEASVTSVKNYKSFD